MILIRQYCITHTHTRTQTRTHAHTHIILYYTILCYHTDDIKLLYGLLMVCGFKTGAGVLANSNALKREDNSAQIKQAQAICWGVIRANSQIRPDKTLIRQ